MSDNRIETRICDVYASSDLETETELAPGVEIGAYRVAELIGQGGMGAVYLAEHRQLKRQVALKVLASHLSRDGEFVARFKREGESLARLRHPSVVEVFDAGEDRGRLYLAMELLRHGSLAEELAELRRADQLMAVDKALAITRQIASALDQAHGAGIVHRDIKPANILAAGEGRYVLTDFGIALDTSRTQLTQAAGWMGTPEYMSPEQAEAKPVDERSDIYALGIVLYEMLTGAPPFRGAPPLALLRQHVETAPRPVEAVRRGIDARVRRVVQTMLAKDPERRFGSAVQLMAALDEARAGLRPDKKIVRVAAPRQLAYGALAGISALVLIGLTGYVLRRASFAPTGVVQQPPSTRVDTVANATVTTSERLGPRDSSANTATATTSERLVLGNSGGCVISGAGQAQCWGLYPYPGITEIRDLPVRPLTWQGPFTALSVNTDAICAYVRGQDVRCAGGRPPLPKQLAPEVKDRWMTYPLQDIKSIRVGGGAVCALTLDQSAYCWGANERGSAGTGAAARVPVAQPTLLEPLRGRVRDIVMGNYHGCALLTDGSVQCWGWRVVLNTDTDVLAPQPIGLTDVYAISAQHNDTCALHTNGKVTCFGSSWSKIGAGVEGRLTEIAALSGTGATQLATGDGFVCVLNSGEVRCVGTGSRAIFKELSKGDATTAYGIPGLSGALELRAGAGFICALMPQGDVRCLGSNQVGQLGDGMLKDSSVPVSVMLR